MSKVSLYSSVGAPLVSSSLQAWKQRAVSLETKDTLLGADLQAVIDHADTTPREKSLARLGLDASPHNSTMGWDGVVAARHAAAQAIASGVGGTLGYAVATAAMQAWQEVPADEWRTNGRDHITEAALKVIVDGTEPNSTEHVLAAGSLDGTKSIEAKDRALLRYQTLEQIAEAGKDRGWGWFKKRPAPPPIVVKHAEPSTLEAQIKKLPQTTQTRVGAIMQRAKDLSQAPGLLPGGSRELYQTEQIHGDFMKTAVEGYLDATAGSTDDVSRQKVEHDFDAQLGMMETALAGIEKRFREQAVARVADHTQFLAQALQSAE